MNTHIDLTTLVIIRQMRSIKKEPVSEICTGR
jgi:hypothetical protein